MSQPLEETGRVSALEAHIREIQGKERASFHMPGHKGGRGAPERGRAFFGDGVYAADLSELSGLDYLHGSRGALARSQENAARVFGADQTWFLVNGATVGNIAAICACVSEGERLLVARDSHRSVYAGIALSGAEPIYLPPVRNDRLDGLYGVDLEDIGRTLESCPDIRAVHVTSPSYYGFTAQVKRIAELAHDRGLPLIVDEAHGSHFALHEDLPASALSCGADLVVQSPHKTLGSLTQSSLLHRRGSLVDPYRLQSNLSMLQSSSPSALLLLSLDLAIDEMALRGKERWGFALKLAQRVRADLTGLMGVTVYGDAIIATPGISGYDPTKLVVDVDQLGTTGFAAQRWLRDTWQINPEFADLRRIVFSITIGDTDLSADLLVDALRSLGASGHVFHRHPNLISLWPATIPQRRLSPRFAQQRSSSAVPIAQAVGRISAEMIIPYPPGVPLLVAGEEVNEEIAATTVQLIEAGSRIVGLADPTGATLRVLLES